MKKKSKNNDGGFSTNQRNDGYLSSFSSYFVPNTVYILIYKLQDFKISFKF